MGEHRKTSNRKGRHILNWKPLRKRGARIRNKALGGGTVNNGLILTLGHQEGQELKTAKFFRRLKASQK